MAETTTIRIDRGTHQQLRSLADERHTTVAALVARGVRLLRQDQLGQQLSGAVEADERDWLDADLG